MSSDEQKWWLAPPGMKPEGPWTISEIRARVESAPAETDWQVCMEGSVEWQPLTDLPAFQPERTPTVSVPVVSVEGTEVNNYLIFMHLSQLGSLVVPMVGFVIPLVMWLVRKDENDLIDLQGREIINWLIFELIAVVLCIVLSFVIIGIPMLIVLGVLGIVFPIIGAVKASRGEFYRYPMMFRVLG